MNKIKHLLLNHQINPDTETLIIGTFNPETSKNEADFFYGRSRNFMWQILPTAFGEETLKGKSTEEKLAFIKKYKIDFIDLIAEVDIEDGQEANYNDAYLDDKVSKWWDVIAELKKLNNIKQVCFTRKTFSGVPNIKKKIEEIEEHCFKNRIWFKNLVTPSRFYREDKQAQWTNFLLASND